MGFVESVPAQKEWKPSSKSEESNQSVEFDWIGIPTTICTSSLDGVGVDDRARTEKEINQEVSGPEAIERRRSSGMYGDGYREKCV
jgi:hypothetical protein